jgi:AbrB family looped-hinge helix DNA binding protein
MRVSVDSAGRVVLPKQIRDAVGLTGGQEVEVRLAGVVIEIEPVQPTVRMRERTGRLPVLEVMGEVEPVTDDDVRAGLDAQRLEREERWG